jgi:hypothetical protein
MVCPIPDVTRRVPARPSPSTALCVGLLRAGPPNGLENGGRGPVGNKRIETRWAHGDIARHPLAQDLIELSPAVIVAPCGPSLRAIRKLSRTVTLTWLTAVQDTHQGDGKTPCCRSVCLRLDQLGVLVTLLDVLANATGESDRSSAQRQRDGARSCRMQHCRQSHRRAGPLEKK